MSPDSHQLLQQTVAEVAERRMAMLSGLAEQYLLQTGLQANEVTLVEEMKDGKYLLYFAKKSDVGATF